MGTKCTHFRKSLTFPLRNPRFEIERTCQITFHYQILNLHLNSDSSMMSPRLTDVNLLS
jgi:hypothetical protein